MFDDETEATNIFSADDPALRKPDAGCDALIKNRVSIKKLQQLLRHQTQTTTKIYLKKIDDDLAKGLRLLEKGDTHRDTQIKKPFVLQR
jgi:hypothetical protein